MTNDDKMLIGVSTVLNKYNIKHCLTFGTLLGIYRDNKIIEIDDIDLAIFNQFWKDDVLWHNFFIDLYKIGYRIHELSHNYICIKALNSTSNLHVDLYFFNQTSDSYYYQNSQRLYTFTKNYFDVLDDIKFQGINFKIPSSTEQFLAYHYGNDWRVPVSPANTVRPNSKSVVNDYEQFYTFIYIEPIYKKDLL